MLPLASQCDNGARSWCTCASDMSCKYLGDKLQCDCGEERKIYEWSWEDDTSVDNVLLSNNKKDVIFHPVYSSGTAAVRGHQRLKQNMHYYWEVKMLTNLYGTDIMIGIGTSKVILSDWKYRFCSMLGDDKESWGYSYRGIIQYGKTSCKYGPQFNIGSLIGIHVDMCAGTLEYYLNRKPLGIAFSDLKSKEIFPMVCSTAAQSAMRITCAVSEVPTLQMACLKVINRNADLLQQYWDIPGLTRMIGEKYFWMTPRPAEEAMALELEDEVVLPTKYFTCSCNRHLRFCRGLMHLPDSETAPDHFLTAQVLSQKARCRSGHLEPTSCNSRLIKNTKSDSQSSANLYGQKNFEE